MNDYLNELIKEFTLDQKTIDDLNIYKALLEEKNQVMNLTSIKGDDIYIKHFYDSLLLYKVNSKMTNLMDVGTGAGFPGLVYAIKEKDTLVYLVEPIKKRCLFLDEVKTKLNVNNAMILNNRCEDLNIKVDFATSRAVAKINVLLELIIPRLNVGGIFYCLKSANYLDELNEAKKAMIILNCQVEHIYRFTLPNSLGERVIIAFKKLKENDPKYPRSYQNIVKKPL